MEHTHTHTHKEDWAFFVCVVIRHQVAIFRRQILFRKNDRSCCLQMNSKITKEKSPLHFLSFLPVPGIMTIWLLELIYLHVSWHMHLHNIDQQTKTAMLQSTREPPVGSLQVFVHLFSSVQIISIPFFFPFTIAKGQRRSLRGALATLSMGS